MRVRLKGINSVSKKLADGSRATYWYAWKGGPRLDGSPGSPEFIASYNRAIEKRRVPDTNTLQVVLDLFQRSSDFTDLRERTRLDYVLQIKKIEKRFGTFPLSALSDRRTRGIFKAWRDELATKSRRQADYAYTVLARVLAWSLDAGHVDTNPCTKAGRLYRGTRVEKVWTDDEEARFNASAPEHLRQAMMLALWTGQREGDLLRLTWSAYDGSTILLRQGKTGARVSIPVGAPLKAMLDGMTKRSPVILTTLEGRPWTPDGFRASWGKAKRVAGIVDRTFHDLRGTAVTRLAKAGCTTEQIATLTGHSLRDAQTILDSHYLNRDPQLARDAITKLERGTKAPN